MAPACSNIQLAVCENVLGQEDADVVKGLALGFFDGHGMRSV